MSILSPSIVTILTDFGLRNHFVASMKGVLLTINPLVQMVDISHEVEPHNILEAAFVLKSAYRYFPKGTIHVVVVDPGVGSSRRCLLVESDEYIFIAPDNGVLTWAIRASSSTRIHELSNARYFLPSEGSTFHGRDRLAPVAGWLSKGVSPGAFGSSIDDPEILNLPEPVRQDPGTFYGHVVCIDRFGNLITDFTHAYLEENGLLDSITIQVGNTRIAQLRSYYSEDPSNQVHALVNSCGHLEIFCYRDRASERLGVSIGDQIRVISHKPNEFPNIQDSRGIDRRPS